MRNRLLQQRSHAFRRSGIRVNFAKCVSAPIFLKGTKSVFTRVVVLWDVCSCKFVILINYLLILTSCWCNKRFSMPSRRLLIFRCYAQITTKYMLEYEIFQTKSKLMMASLESPETRLRGDRNAVKNKGILFSLTIWKFVILSLWLLSTLLFHSITVFSLNCCLSLHNVTCSIYQSTFTRPLAPVSPRAGYRLTSAHGGSSLGLRPRWAGLR